MNMFARKLKYDKQQAEERYKYLLNLIKNNHDNWWNMILAQAEYDRLIKAEPQRVKNYEILSSPKSIEINGQAYKYPNKLIKRSGQTVTIKIPLNLEVDEHKNVGTYKHIGEKPSYGVRIYKNYVQQKGIKNWKEYIYDGNESIKNYYPIYQKIVEKIGQYIYKYCDMKHYYEETYVNWISYSIIDVDIQHGQKITWNYANIIIKQGYITYTLEQTEKQKEDYKDMVTIKKIYIEKQKATDEDKQRIKEIYYRYNNQNKISKMELFWTFKDAAWQSIDQIWNYTSDQDVLIKSMSPDIFQKFDAKKIQYLAGSNDYQQGIEYLKEKYKIDEEDDNLKILTKDGKMYKPIFVSTYWCVQPALIAQLFNGETPMKIYNKIKSDFKDYNQVSEINMWICHKKWGIQRFETGESLFRYMVEKDKRQLQSGRPQRQFLKRQGINGKVATAYWFYGNRFSRDTPIFTTELQIRDYLRKQSYATMKIYKNGDIKVFPQHSDETINMMQRIKVIGDIHSTADDSILHRNRKMYDEIRFNVLRKNDINSKEKLISFYPADVQYVTLTLNISWSVIQIGKAFGIWQTAYDNNRVIQNYLNNSKEYNEFIDWYNVQKEKYRDFYNYEQNGNIGQIIIKNQKEQEQEQQENKFKQLIKQFETLKLHQYTQQAKIQENQLDDNLFVTNELLENKEEEMYFMDQQQQLIQEMMNQSPTSEELKIEEFREMTKQYFEDIKQGKIDIDLISQFAIACMDTCTETYDATWNKHKYLLPVLDLLCISGMITMEEHNKVDGINDDEEQLIETVEKGIQIAELRGFAKKDVKDIIETFEPLTKDDIFIRILRHNAQEILGEEDDDEEDNE